LQLFSSNCCSLGNAFAFRQLLSTIVDVKKIQQQQKKDCFLLVQPYYDNINGLEQKEATMDKGIEEVNNNWSIDDGKNDGENGNNSGNNWNKNAITIDSTCYCNNGEGDAW
jgi:hypothetical protein